MVAILGKCLCGAVRFQAEEQPRPHYCHCTMCQKATGAPAAVLAWVPRAGFAWIGEGRPTEYRSSPLAVRSFCPTCGSPIALAYDGENEIGLHIATLDRRAEFAPKYHYGSESRLPWFDAGPNLSARATEERW